MSISPTHSLARKEDRKVKASSINGEVRITKRNKEKYERTEDLIEEVYADITNGLAKSQVIRKLKLALYEPQQGKMPRAQNYPYEIYNAALARMREDAEIKKDDLKNIVYGQFLSVFNEAVEIGDRQSALRALENIAKMNSLYNDDVKTNVNISTEGSGDVKISFGFNDESQL